MAMPIETVIGSVMPGARAMSVDSVRLARRLACEKQDGFAF
jgi:hypothetical protein